MNRITKIILIVISAGVLISLLAYLTYLNANHGLEKNTDASTAWPGEVDWATAIEILNSGQVIEVVQSHDLEVTLTLEDGNQLKTIEPALDEIFQEIKLCGSDCREILLITE
jgi:hypothetical protein